MENIFVNGQWLPLVFAFLMGLAMLIYAVLDGYDMGVGILSLVASEEDKDIMIASIGPFWDANETWLVLGVGILLVAFPAAHGVILSNLYLPVAFMLVGLILRGVAFDYRNKTKPEHKHWWNKAFFGGSLLMAYAQGWMLGNYILGFKESALSLSFCLIVGFCVAAGYALMGAGWLIMKTEGKLQQQAVQWARLALIGTALGIIVVSLATPFASPRIFDKWFDLPAMFWLAPIPLITGCLVIYLYKLLGTLPQPKDRLCWAPFTLTVGIYVLCFVGLAYSFFPYIVPEQMRIVDAASAPESLIIILAGALLVLPVLIGYTIYAYRVFWGKAGELRYH